MISEGDIGFIGAGTLTGAVVAGLRSLSSERTIRLSPRSEKISAELAKKFPNIQRELSNAAVVEKCQTIFLAVRPQQLDEALEGLTFRSEQIIISFVATVPVEDVRRLVYPARRVCRATPLPAIALARGPVIIYPNLSEAVQLFQDLGDLVLAESEDEIMKLGCASAAMSSFFEIIGEITTWLEANGVPNDRANLYVRSLFAGLAETGRTHVDLNPSELTMSHETPGGLNEHVRTHLQNSNTFENLRRSLESVSARVLRAET